MSLLVYPWFNFFSLPVPWHCTRHPYPQAPFSSPTQLVLAGHGREVDGSSNERSTVPIKCLRFYSLVFPNTAMSQQSKRGVRHFFYFSLLSCFFFAMFASLEGLTLVPFSFYFLLTCPFPRFSSLLFLFLFHIYNFISLSFHSMFLSYLLRSDFNPYSCFSFWKHFLFFSLSSISSQTPFTCCRSIFILSIFLLQRFHFPMFICYSLFRHHSVILSLQLQIFTRFCGSHSDIFLSASLSIRFKIHSHISFSCLKVFQFFFLIFIPSMFSFASLWVLSLFRS